MGSWHSDTADRLYVSDSDGDAWLYNPATGLWDTIGNGSAGWNFVQFRGNLYMVNGVDQSRKFNGTTTANLGETYSSDFAAPSTDKMPRARQIAVHQGHVWLADTLESSTRHATRLRFSHPNTAEAWRSLDWIDVDAGVNAEPINNLIPYQDHMLVFKETSTYAIFGFGWDSWTLQPASREVGAVAPGAACATPNGVYFFSWPDGVMRWDGRRVEWVFSRLAPALRDGSIPASRRDEVRLGWADNRLWVSVPWGVSDYRVLVLDPSLGREGSWVMYDMPIGKVMELDGSSGAVPVAPHRSEHVALEVVKRDQPWDDYGTATDDAILPLPAEWPESVIARVASSPTGDGEPLDVTEISDLEYGITATVPIPTGTRVAQVIVWGSSAGTDSYHFVGGHIDVFGADEITLEMDDDGTATVLSMDGDDILTVAGSLSGTTTIHEPSKFELHAENDSDTRTSPVPGGAIILWYDARVPIQTVYRTRWFDADVDAMKKRWRRLWATYWGDGEGELRVDLYYDYNSADRRKGFSETVIRQSGTPVWGDADWGDFEWGGAGTNHAIRRAISLGNAHAVQLRFRGPVLELAPWGLESITLPFQRRRVR